MPTAISLAGASFSNPLIKGLPALANMEGWAYFGGDLAKSQNVGSGGAWTNFLAGPTWFPNYAHCVNGVGAIQTPIGLRAAETSLFAARMLSIGGDAGTGALSDRGCAVAFIPSFIAGGLQVTTVGTLQTVALVDHPVTPWRFYAVTTGGGVVPAVYDLTNNLSAVGATPTTNTPSTAIKVLGSSNSAAFPTNNRQIDIAFFGFYAAVLSKANIDLIYASVKQSLALRGIAV